jgi:uncharacterized protein YebE (UPF0316 family)
VVDALGRTPVPLPHTINTPAAKGNWHRQTIIFSSLYFHMQKQDEEFHCFAPLVIVCNLLQYVIGYSMQLVSLQLVTVCNWLQYSIGYSMQLVTFCNWLQYAIGYSLQLVTVCNWLQYAIGYSIQLVTVCNWLQYTIGYSMQLVTVCNCSIESNKRERAREKLMILVCWGMVMCRRLGDCVIGS